MNFQMLFYTLGTIIFALMLIFMIVMGVFLFIMIKKVNQLQKQITQIVERASDHPGELMIEAGSALIGKAIEKFGEKKRK